MRFYLMRHGHALSTADAGVASDQERPLSEEGRGEVRSSIGQMLKAGARPRLLLVSPLKRAQQTAQEAAKTMRPSPEVRTSDLLANQISGQELCRRLLKDPPPAQEVLLIGHQPQLGDLAAYLAGGFHPLPTASIVGLELDDRGKAKLLWSLSP